LPERGPWQGADYALPHGWIPILSLVCRPLPRGALRIVALAVVVTAVTIGVVARRAGIALGAPLAPFFWANLLFPARHPWWPLPSLAVTLALGLALLRSPRLPAWAFVVAASFLALGSRLGLAVGQRGEREWWWPLVRPNSLVTEYPAAYPFLRGHVLAFVDRFAETVPLLPVHPSGHPVGATLAFYALDSATGGPHGTAIALCALGALAVVPTFLLGRALGGEAAARCAVVLFVLAPDTLIYGATSYDAAFVPVTTLCAWLLVTRRVRLGALAATAAFLLSYALALAPLWAALVLGRRGGLRAAVWCAGTALAILGLMAITLGYDPIEAILQTQRAYARGIGSVRPQWYWVVGGPAAFLVMLGPLLAERFLAAAERADAAARALLACLLLAALSGVLEAEVERILQFAVPLAAVAAAPVVRSRRWLALGLALGLAQAYFIEVRWDTTF
jgi:hypothetical protein